MKINKHEWIQNRAFEIWVKEGSNPNADSNLYWDFALREWEFTMEIWQNINICSFEVK